MSPGITEEVQKQAEETNQQPIHHLRPDVALKETQRGRRYGKFGRIAKKQENIRLLGFRKKKKRNDRGVPNGACTNQDTRRPMWKYLTK